MEIETDEVSHSVIIQSANNTGVNVSLVPCFLLEFILVWRGCGHGIFEGHRANISIV